MPTGPRVETLSDVDVSCFGIKNTLNSCTKKPSNATEILPILGLFLEALETNIFTHCFMKN